MNHPPQPSTYGQTKGFHRRLYQELLQAGYEHPDLLEMSLSKALLARYGSWQAVDQELGEGTFQGVKQRLGGLSTWRKAWSDVRREQKARYMATLAALAALRESVESCRKSGVSDQQILTKVQALVSAGNWRPAA